MPTSTATRVHAIQPPGGLRCCQLRTDAGAGEVVPYNFIYCKKQKQRRRQGDPAVHSCTDTPRTLPACERRTVLAQRLPPAACHGLDAAQASTRPPRTCGHRSGPRLGIGLRRAPCAKRASSPGGRRCAEPRGGTHSGNSRASPHAVTRPGLHIALDRRRPLGGPRPPWGRLFLHLCLPVRGHYRPVIFGSQRGNEQRPL